MNCNTEHLLGKFPSLTQEKGTSNYTLSDNKDYNDLAMYVNAFNNQALDYYGIDSPITLRNMHNEAEIREELSFDGTSINSNEIATFNQAIQNYNKKYNTYVMVDFTDVGNNRSNVKFINNDIDVRARLEINDSKIAELNHSINELNKDIENQEKVAENIGNEVMGQIMESDDSMVDNYYQEIGMSVDTRPLFSTKIINSSLNLEQTNKPTNYKEWFDSRLNIKKMLNQKVKHFYNQKDYQKVGEINRLIESIDNQIVEAKKDLTDPKVVHKTAMDEIELVTDFLMDINKDAVNAANALDVNQIESRIDFLKHFFLGEVNGIANIYEELGDDLSKEAPFYKSMKDNLSETEFKEIYDKVQNIKNLYEKAKGKIIVGILTNDTLVNNLIDSGTWESALDKDGNTVIPVLEELKQMIINREGLDVGMVEKFTLGGFSGGGLLGQLLASLRNNQLSKETGSTQTALNRLSDNWLKIKDKKDKDGNFISNSLYQKDNFGVRNNKLISRYSNTFFEKMALINQAKTDFYISETSSDYSKWMAHEKVNYDRIQPSMINEIKEAIVPGTDMTYGEHPAYKDYFNKTTEDSKKYNDYLKKVLGQTTYSREISKALDMINAYHIGIVNDMLTPLQIIKRNPFAFADNFYSKNAMQADKNSGEYLEPRYVRSIPKLDNPDFYNKEFERIENSEHGPDLMEFYKDAADLSQEYINPTMRSEGVKVTNADILSLEDTFEREMFSQLNVFGKLTKGFKNIVHDYLRGFYDGNISSQNRRLAEFDTKARFNVHYRPYGRQQIDLMTKSLLNNETTELLKIANQEIGGNIIAPQFTDNHDLNLYKYRLANSIARNRINKTTSSNIFESIKSGTIIANDTRARRATVATLEAMKEFVGKPLDKDQRNINNGSGIQDNLFSFLESWGNANVYGEKNSLDLQKNNLGRKITHHETNSKRFKFKSEAEKKLIEVLKKDIETNNNDGFSTFNFNFKFEDQYVKYHTDKNGKFFKTVDDIKSEVTYEEVQAMYNEYLGNLIQQQGINLTSGGLLQGIAGSFIRQSLFLNPRSGINNRLQGMSQNLSVAASSRYGFNMVDYQYARRMLFGTNTLKYINKAITIPTKRGKNIETLQMFQSAMELFQNRADELSNVGRFEGRTINNFATALADFALDFSLNNPEWHNQTEIVLSILQNTKVIDIHGNQRHFLDRTNGEFIYIPGTMELKPEFDTPRNRDLWVNFTNHIEETKDKNGEVIETKKDATSLQTISNIKLAIHRTQGNYDNKDVIMIQNSAIGSLATIFKRYLFENTNLQYGTDKVDLRSGELNVKGRKVALFEHIPTTVAYFAALNAGGFIGTGIAAAFGVGATISALPLLIAGGSTALTLGALKYLKKTSYKQSQLSKQELNLGLNFLGETFLRAVNTPLNVASYGKINILGETIEKYVNNSAINNTAITEADRRLLSESAQDISSKFAMYFYYTALAYAASSLYNALFGIDDEDRKKDDPTDQYYELKQRINFEGRLNALLNNRNIIMSEFDKFANVKDFQNEAFTVPLANYLIRGYATINGDQETGAGSAYERYQEGKISGADMSLRYLKLLPIPMPNTMMKTALSDDSSVFEDARVYDGKTDFDKFLLYSKIETPDKEYQKAVTKKRTELKREAQDVVRKALVKKYRSEGKADYLKSGAFKEEIDKEVTKIMKPATKKKGKSYQTLYENEEAWNKIEDKIKNYSK